MIAIVSSCITPLHNKNGVTNHISASERQKQTIYTLERLEAYHFKRIILVDNSVNFDFSFIQKKFKKIEVMHIKQYQFENKGLNELLMLLAVVDELPENEPIFKISGRYFPNDHFEADMAKNFDFKVKGYDYNRKMGTISTRAYFVRNKELYRDFLLKTFNEIFLYPGRVVGIRSFAKMLMSNIKPVFHPSYNTSIEFAAARVLKKGDYDIDVVPIIGIQGKIAGFNNANTLSE